MQSPLKYPAFNMPLRKKDGQTYVQDLVRKKWLVLSPEEFVRQHLLYYLMTVKQYPASLIAVEKELRLNDLKKRYDLVVYDRNKQPYLLVECKAPYIDLNESVIEQALRYNLVLKAPLLMITNGVSDVVFTSAQQVVELPTYTHSE